MWRHYPVLIMSEYTQAFIVAIDGVVVVTVFALAGVALTRTGVIPRQLITPEGSKVIRNMTVNLLLPCLMFNEMLKDLDLSSLEEFGMIFFFCTGNCQIAHIIIGLILGYFLAKITKANTGMTSLMMMCVSHQDTTTVPLIYAQVLTSDALNKVSGDYNEKMVGYILIYSVFITVYKWTVAYK